MLDLEEKSLVELAKNGDCAASWELLSRNRAIIEGTTSRLLRGNDDVPDIVRNVQIKVVENIGQFKGRAKFSTWVYRITRNTCLDYLKSLTRRQVPLPASEDDSSEGTSIGPSEAAKAYSKHRVDEDEKDRLRLWRKIMEAALDETDPWDQNVIKMAVIDELDIQTVMRRANLKSQNRVYQIIYKFRDRCRSIRRRKYGDSNRLFPPHESC
jgi:RNA polymerase sigma factor (sigma-70 family)